MEQRFRSPDGRFELIVRKRDGEFTIGLDGFPWHTHGDVLSAEYEFDGVPGLDEDSAVRRFVSDVLENRVAIAVEKAGDEIVDAWVTSDPAQDLQYKPEDREIEFRFWNGESAA